jgi:hypothetical protein
MTHCPKCGAASTDPEFCSECGAAMSAPAATVSPPADGQPPACPVCAEPRPGSFARYCDNCRYDFVAKQPFSADPPPPEPSVPPTARPVALPAQWDLYGAVDLSLRRPEDPMPTDLRERIFPLDVADHLIGRRSDKEDIHPEIVIDDPGISRRHARILRTPDGTLSLLDLASMNGTRVDGAAVEPNVPVTLGDGSQITIGCWTRLTVKAR